MNRVQQYEWAEWVELAATRHKGSSFADRGAFCPESMEQALERARGAGYWEALPEAERFAARVEAEVQLSTMQTTFTSTWDVAGSEVDMGRFLAGEPECMIESLPYKVARQGRAVRVVVPSCYASQVPTETVRQRGAAVVALCMILARAQHPVEVWADYANHGTGGRNRYAFAVRVQHANEPLDEGRLMFALAHETANRRLCFSVKEQQSAAVRNDFRISDTAGGYGQSPRHALVSDVPDAEANTILLSDFDVEPDWSEGKAVAWINRTIEALFS